MGFASAYLNDRTIFPVLINEAPDTKTGIITVVPAYNEPAVITLLDSLYMCTEPPCKVEVIIIVNAPSDADAGKIAVNRETITRIEQWKREKHDCFFRVFPIDVQSSGFINWGVGLARKTGMDEAVRRFNHLNRPDGIILNIDADCTVSDNYFTEVYEQLAEKRNRSACSIYFEHPLEGIEYPEHVYQAIALYELHLRYYVRGLLFSGFPYAYHTIGSAVAVKAVSYMKVGGMNRRMAGEDFYFIQKLALAGGYFYLNQTTVYPSPRTSVRVPFGTGATIARMEETGKNEFLTYDLNAFRELEILFRQSERFFRSGGYLTGDLYSCLPAGIRSFVDRSAWENKIIEIRANTSSAESSIKRFYDWFNLFRVVKYMNFVHQGIFTRKNVVECAGELLSMLGIDSDSNDPVSLLKRFRDLEKET
jgi:hypothetical protein